MSRSADISPLSVLLSKVDAAAAGSPSHDTFASGFPSLDELLGGGFRRGDLIVLGGDVGSGKSAPALAIAFRAATRNKTVFDSGESDPERSLVRELNTYVLWVHARRAMPSASAVLPLVTARCH